MSKLPTQVNFRNKGHTLCIDHPKEELVLVCKDCNETLVCVHCVSTTHLGHQLTAVNLLVQDHFNYLQDWNVDTEETKIPRLSRRVEEAEVTVKEFQQGIQLHIKKVHEHGEHLKGLIEKSTSETVAELKKIEKKILKQFEKFKSESDNAIRQLKALMKESIEVTLSDNNVLICDVTKELSSLSLPEPEFKTSFNSLRFIKGLDPESFVKDAFGRLERDLSTVQQDHPALSQNPVKLPEPIIITTVDARKIHFIKTSKYNHDALVKQLKLTFTYLELPEQHDGAVKLVCLLTKDVKEWKVLVKSWQQTALEQFNKFLSLLEVESFKVRPEGWEEVTNCNYVKIKRLSA